MEHKILITTFATWKSHQPSNASDDLLGLLLKKELDFFQHLRKIPVDFELAPQHVLIRFNELRPKVLVCCGMAEERTKLNVESRAVRDEKVLHTGIDLQQLTADLVMTEISHDTGRFVCNALYYSMLEHLAAQEGEHHCLFIHVPVLTEENKEALAEDFERILQRISEMLL
ncbi:peptidase C15 [Sulfurimonas sp. HSL3-7]|uniref:pyroglutamyl-peptidase I family protein n=1 Tax=Sulfonitrofixus jiaomeiensis TaxID=3131938 RepID=UPI0031F78513